MAKTTLETYLETRSSLISEDRSQRSDQGKQYSSIELSADQIVRKIRAEEAVSVWGQGEDATSVYHPNGDAPRLFPGMEFLTAKRTILRTRLFKILKQMPKGGLLHAHLDATVNAEVLLRLALQHPAIHICVSAKLDTRNLGVIPPEFKPLPQSYLSSTTSITSMDYTPGEYVPILKARESFDSGLGGPDGFDQWVIDSLMIQPSEAYDRYETSTKIWRKFRTIFEVAAGLVLYRPIWSEYIRNFLVTSLEDGISYVEARIEFHHHLMYDADGQLNVSHREWIADFDNIVNEVRSSRPEDFIGARVIYTTVRYFSAEELEWYLEDCLQLKQEFPHLIAGFDLVGHEDSLKSLIEYIEPLTRFVTRQKELGLDIPFIFHAGETLGDGNKADMNLYDAILLGTKRIGHGFSLVKHPKLMEMCRTKGIAVEVCPISNEILRLTSSMPMHPLPILLNHGVPVVLSSDDPAVFGNMGLTFDFFQVLVASEVNGLVTLGEIAQDSIRYSTLTDAEKAKGLALWRRKWGHFVATIVEEHRAVLEET